MESWFDATLIVASPRGLVVVQRVASSGEKLKSSDVLTASRT